MPSHRVEEFRLVPGLATVGAHRNFDYVSLAGPSSAGNRIDPVRGKGFVNTWPCDLGLQLHFCQRAAHWISIHRNPIGVIRCLPVAVKRLTYGLDTRQPLD